MAHQTPSAEHKDRAQAHSQLYIPSSRTQSQRPASQTLRHFAATADSAAPYISPYPPTTASNANPREELSVKESALTGSTLSCSSSPQASSIYSSAGSASGNMSAASKTISGVCDILLYPSKSVSHSIIFLLLPMRCICCACSASFSHFKCSNWSGANVYCICTLILTACTSCLSLLNLDFRTRKLN